MQFAFITLLLAATCSSVFAKPLPVDFNDIQRRWSEGMSEVCATAMGQLPACYVREWLQSLHRRREAAVCLSYDCGLCMMQHR